MLFWVMTFIKHLYIWRRGWRDLIHHHDVARYRLLPWLWRLRLDALALIAMIRAPCFRRTIIAAMALYVSLLIIGWKTDLSSLTADALQMVLWLLVLPLIARGRRMMLLHLLSAAGSKFREQAHRHRRRNSSS